MDSTSLKNQTTPRKPEDSPPLRNSWRRSVVRVGRWFVLGWLVFIAVGIPYVWLVMQPTMGRSVQFLVSISMGLVTIAVLLLWLLFFSPFRWKTALPLSLLVIVPLAALAASIRDVDMTGDMLPVPRFRWDPTLEQRLATYREHAPRAAAADVPLAAPEDLTIFRGAGRDGVVIGPPLSQDWTAHPPEELWRRPCGEGYASFSVLGDFLVTIEQRGENESIVCYDAKTGGERWIEEYAAHFDEAAGGPGPRTTPTLDAGKVYALGAVGDLTCLDLATGDVVWRINIVKDNGLATGDALPVEGAPKWAYSGSPLVTDGMVIINAGGPVGNGLVAYDAADGRRLWQAAGLDPSAVAAGGENRAGYSSPLLAELAGTSQLLIFDGVGLRGCDPADGRQLWFHQFDETGGDPGRVNVALPLIVDVHRVFISASYGRGCEMLSIDRQGDDWTVASLWKNMHLRSKFSNPVLHNGRIYGLDEGILVGLDVETGKRTVRSGRFGHGQILLTNGQMVILSEGGELVLLDLSGDQPREIGRQAALAGAKTWNPPALVRGRAYVRNHIEMAAFDLTSPN